MIETIALHHMGLELRDIVWMFKDELMEDEEENFKSINIDMSHATARVKTKNEFERCPKTLKEQSSNIPSQIWSSWQGNCRW